MEIILKPGISNIQTVINDFVILKTNDEKTVLVDKKTVNKYDTKLGCLIDNNLIDDDIAVMAIDLTEFQIRNILGIDKDDRDMTEEMNIVLRLTDVTKGSDFNYFDDYNLLDSSDIVAAKDHIDQFYEYQYGRLDKILTIKIDSQTVEIDLDRLGKIEIGYRHIDKKIQTIIGDSVLYIKKEHTKEILNNAINILNEIFS